ncbi:MAG: AMP-binding protein [Proteobacteria bacterium]|nr:AMP-binding protein [Pseudomonadota bacterium]
MDIAGLLSQHAKYTPGNLALVFEHQRLTYAELEARVNRLAHAMLDAGIGKGDRAVTVLPNCMELLEVYWACAKTGIVVVPLSPLLLATGLASLLGDAEPRIVFACKATLPLLHATATLTSGSALCVLTDGAAEDGYAEFVEGKSPSSPPADVLPDDVYNIMYTSGTTGMPKGIIHTQRIRAHYCTLFANAWRLKPESVVLHTGAIIFNGAFVTLMPCLMQGATYVLHRQFDPVALIETVARERVTHTMLVPSQIIAVLNAPNFDAAKLASLEVLLSLGAPLPVVYKDVLENCLPGRFHELYGLTEGFVTILDRRDAIRKRGSVGVPPPFFEMRIMAENGSEAATGEVGEIVGRGPILMPGYYRRPDLTSEALQDGWLYTGDLGHVDAEGYLYLVDRKKDMIDSGGVKVYPRDVEEVISAHPAVLEAVVFGIPDTKWGETPVAAVMLKTSAALDPETLKAWINERVGARYQKVSRVMIVDAFPRNAAGKILKRELRAPFWEGHAANV